MRKKEGGAQSERASLYRVFVFYLPLAARPQRARGPLVPLPPLPPEPELPPPLPAVLPPLPEGLLPGAGEAKVAVQYWSHRALTSVLGVMLVSPSWSSPTVLPCNGGTGGVHIE